jgi:hypothetical protein
LSSAARHHEPPISGFPLNGKKRAQAAYFPWELLDLTR